MELNNVQLQELKNVELEILKEFIIVCKKLNLKYFISDGTLIGVVRHKGFIPWDDDIDVRMLREDYEVFIREGQKYLPEHLFVQTHYTDNGYINNFAKIRNSNTAFIEKTVINFDMNHGAFIDIFPIDNAPAENEIKKYNFKKRLYGSRVFIEYNIENQEKKKRTKMVEALLRILFPDVKKVVEKQERLHKLSESGDTLVNNYYSDITGRSFPAKWYEETIEAEFEGVVVDIPKEYHEILSFEYGNYMELPPEEERIAHHFVEIFDMTKSYKEYI